MRLRPDYQMSQLDVLEAEAVHIMREVAAEFERPALLFSGGKDSIVMLALAEKAFWPARIPFPVMHVDTGHNFPEALEFRDRRVAELGVRLVVASVQESIDAGRVTEETAPVQVMSPTVRYRTVAVNDCSSSACVRYSLTASRMPSRSNTSRSCA